MSSRPAASAGPMMLAVGRPLDPRQPDAVA